ncbi:MAG: alkylation response protein AidB-like acyl-CoA dehydrogenase [Lentisphaeria bacterium]|jgi:alkylation response protein AidB-like acyl-CoA dehydrogenase
MPNFFTDNKDLMFHFENIDLEKAVAIIEHDFEPDENDPLRPSSYHDAMEMYRSSLELCGDISANFIAPRSQAIDTEGALLIDGKVKYATATLEAQKCLSDAGFMGVIVPRKFGGLDFPATIYIMMIEMVSQADASMMTMFGYQDIGEAIAHLAPEEVAMQFLPEYCEGKKVGAMVLTEPGGGSDLQAIRVKAQQGDDGTWRLSGVKQFISHGNGDVLLVLARSESDTPGMFGLSLFAVHGGSKNNVTVARIEEKMGLHGSPTCELHFEEAVGHLVGNQKFGLFHVVDILNHARFSVAAQGLGIAEAAYLAALEYTRERKAFGKTIYDMPSVADILIDMRVMLNSGRAMVYAGSQWLDIRNKLHEKIEKQKAQGVSPEKEDRIALKEAQRILDLLSPLVKYTVTEAANRVCYLAQQLHGGIGYIREYTVERCVRDVRITTIYEGTTQVLVGLAIKHAQADVLAKYFDSVAALPAKAGLSPILEKLQTIRTIFAEAKSSLKQKDDFFKAAAAKELTDTYANLYAGHLLLEGAIKDPSRTPLLKRFVTQALAKARASQSNIDNDLYDDGSLVDEICG